MTAGRRDKEGTLEWENNLKSFKSKEIKFQRSLNVGRAKVSEASTK